MANEQNLKRFGKEKPAPSSEQAKKAGSKGGKASAAGFLHKQTITTDNNAPIIRYCLVTPVRNIVFYNSDIKSIREERYGN